MVAGAIGQPGKPVPLRVGDAVEAYWPDEKIWLQATLAKPPPDRQPGRIRVSWEDGTQSDMPTNCVRRLPKRADPKGAMHPKGALLPKGAAMQPRPVGIQRGQFGSTVPPIVPPAARSVPQATMQQQPLRQQPLRQPVPDKAPGRPLDRHAGAQRDTRPAWMTKGIGVGEQILGEATGDLLKPGLTRQDLEDIEKKGHEGPDPFGDVFREATGAKACVSKASSVANTKPKSDRDEPCQTGPPVYERKGVISFDGTASSVIDEAYSPDPNPAGSFTVDFKVKFNGGDGFRSPVCSRSIGPNRGYAFFVLPTGRWAFWMALGQRPSEWAKVQGALVKKGELQHITGTFCEKEGEARLCVDGEWASTSDRGHGYVPNQSRPLRLGAGASEGSVIKFPFNGQIEDFKVYNYAMSSQSGAGASSAGQMKRGIQGVGAASAIGGIKRVKQ